MCGCFIAVADPRVRHQGFVAVRSMATIPLHRKTFCAPPNIGRKEEGRRANWKTWCALRTPYARQRTDRIGSWTDDHQAEPRYDLTAIQGGSNDGSGGRRIRSGQRPGWLAISRTMISDSEELLKAAG